MTQTCRRAEPLATTHQDHHPSLEFRGYTNAWMKLRSSSLKAGGVTAWICSGDGAAGRSFILPPLVSYKQMCGRIRGSHGHMSPPPRGLEFYSLSSEPRFPSAVHLLGKHTLNKSSCISLKLGQPPAVVPALVPGPYINRCDRKASKLPNLSHLQL